MNLQGQRVILTGATGGIGEAIATELAAAGATLILTGRQAPVLQALTRRLPGQHHWVAADLCTRSGRDDLVALVSRLGGASVLINNAGSNVFRWLEDQGDEALSAQVNLNLLAPMLLVQALLPLLHREPQAAVVNIGSTFGSIGHPGFSAYCASKFGLRGFSEALARELADTGIVVSYLAPRATQTDLNSAAVVDFNQAAGNAMDSPAVVAAAVLDMLRTGQARRWLGWPERFFAWLNQAFPSLVDRALRSQLGLIKSHAKPKEILT